MAYRSLRRHEQNGQDTNDIGGSDEYIYTWMLDIAGNLMTIKKNAYGYTGVQMTVQPLEGESMEVVIETETAGSQKGKIAR